MPDLDHTIGGDLSVSAGGDLLTADGLALSQQRVLRRLLTNPTVNNADGTNTPGDYLWHPEYGAGLPAYVGRTADVPQITALIRGQMSLEATVLQNPQPQVSVSPIAGGIFASVQYAESDSGQNSILSFDVSP